MASAPLTRDEVLDELDFLATATHALIVEYRTLCCAFGNGLAADEGGTATDQGREAASTAATLALSRMFHLKSLNLNLVQAGRSPQLGRADAIASASVPEIPLGPPTAQQLADFPAREDAIARAMDERYKRLEPAVTSAPVFEGDLLENVRGTIVGEGSIHATGVASLRAVVGRTPPAELVIVTGREPADAFDERLLKVSDQGYGLTLAALGHQFGETDFFAAGTFRALATDVMLGLDDVHSLLVLRGLLPPFTLG